MPTAKTPHGMVPAEDFLHNHLQNLLGEVEVKIEPRTGRNNKVDVRTYIRPKNNQHWTSIDVIEWDRSLLPREEEVSSCKVILTACESADFYLKRFVYMEFEGLDSIPGISKVSENIHAYLFHWGDPLLSEEDPVLKEFQRRWKIEAAHELAKNARQRIKLLKAKGPYFDD